MNVPSSPSPISKSNWYTVCRSQLIQNFKVFIHQSSNRMKTSTRIRELNTTSRSQGMETENKLRLCLFNQIAALCNRSTVSRTSLLYSAHRLRSHISTENYAKARFRTHITPLIMGNVTTTSKFTTKTTSGIWNRRKLSI